MNCGAFDFDEIIKGASQNVALGPGDVLAGALDDLVEVERAIAVYRQVRLGEVCKVVAALGLDRDGLIAEGVAAVPDVVGKGLGIALHGG
jgi:hypothetical protein